MTNKANDPFAQTPRLRYPRGGRTRALSQWVLSSLVRRGARPGDKLPTEQELCRLFKVSRSTVRQALKSLDSFGLVDARPRRGSVLKAARTQDLGPLFGAVMVLSTRAPRGAQDEVSQAHEARHLAHLAEARWVQERAMLALACQRRTSADLAALLDEEQSYTEAVRRVDAGAAREADAAYHRALVAAAHNPVLSGLTELIDGYFALLKTRDETRAEESWAAQVARTAREHAELRSALEAREEDRALRILDRHLRRIVDMTRQGTEA